MYYNIHNQNFLNSTPSNITLANGTLVTGPITDINILADAGYLSVRNDGPNQPENTVENVAARIVNIDKPYVDIIRTWLPIQIPVPDNISARQVRLWLLQNGISLNQVEDAIDTINDPLLRESTRVEWEYAPYIERNHPLIESLAQYLGLTSEQIDQGFIDASQI
jgi:hypothetical protein